MDKYLKPKLLSTTVKKNTVFEDHPQGNINYPRQTSKITLLN